MGNLHFASCLIVIGEEPLFPFVFVSSMTLFVIVQYYTLVFSKVKPLCISISNCPMGPHDIICHLCLVTNEL
jgi:hypothetical protein